MDKDVTIVLTKEQRDKIVAVLDNEASRANAMARVHGDYPFFTQLYDEYTELARAVETGDTH